MLESVWPDVEIKQRPKAPGAEPYVRSYVFMRLAIGVLGFLLPPLLVFLEPILFDGQPYPRGSLSAYYYSGVRELFVGMLCAIGVFLVIYKIADRTRESRVSTYAGIAVIVVALFPTGKPGAGVPPTPLQNLLGGGTRRGHPLLLRRRVHLSARADHPLLRQAPTRAAPPPLRVRGRDRARPRPRRDCRLHRRAGQGDSHRRVDRRLGVRDLVARHRRARPHLRQA